MTTPRNLLVVLAGLALATASHAQESGGSLEVTVQNGTPPTTQSQQAAPAPKPNRASTGRARTALPPLPSRSGAFTRGVLRPTGQAAPKKVLARVGTVIAERIEIRASPSDAAPALSVVQKDVNLAVLTETDTHYGVLMANDTQGWVPKSAVALIDYNTEVNAPQDPQSATPETGNVLDGLDPREQGILREAFTYLGVPYVWAGNSRNGLDCSGFVKNVYKATTGTVLPRHSGDQARVGQAITGETLRPGDRLYFAMKGGGTVTHCGIYIGNGYFIHASTNHGQVAVDPIYQNSHYAKKLVAIRR